MKLLNDSYVNCTVYGGSKKEMEKQGYKFDEKGSWFMELYN